MTICIIVVTPSIYSPRTPFSRITGQTVITLNSWLYSWGIRRVIRVRGNNLCLLATFSVCRHLARWFCHCPFLGHYLVLVRSLPRMHIWEVGRETARLGWSSELWNRTLLKLILLYNEHGAAVGMATPTWKSTRCRQMTCAVLSVNLINGFFNSSLLANGKVEAKLY